MMTQYHGLDTPDQVFFYEQDFYVLSNFSSFKVLIWGVDFPTSEHAYHFAKFSGADDTAIRESILKARSAHDAYQIASVNKPLRRSDWDNVKLGIMEAILVAKVSQHEYVHRKLLLTGNRTLIENSWRDDYWGWGPNKDGQNMLGKLWMKVRHDLRTTSYPHD